jgi:hypothetical protein
MYAVALFSRRRYGDANADKRTATIYDDDRRRTGDG